MLIKIEQDNYGYEILDYIDKETTLPKDIQEHIAYHVPLLDTQIRRLRKLINKPPNKQSTTPVTNSVISTLLKNSMNRQETSTFPEKLKETNTFLEQRRETAKLSNDEIAEIAYQLVLRGETSATTISHIIRDNYNVNKEYSLSLSRRPRIYATVLSGLHSYADKGLIYHDRESSGIKDSYFFPNPL